MTTELLLKFENTFGIPFTLNRGIAGRDPWFEIGPKGNSKEYFSLICRFSNDVRFTMELLPGTYSRPFFTDLGLASEEQKRIFVSYAKLLTERHANISFTINHIKASIEDYTAWPANWMHVALRVSRSPISSGEVDYDRIFVDWGTIAMGMILSLASIIPIVEESKYDEQAQAEGTPNMGLVTRYERNPINRKLCLAAKGYSCEVCGLNFEKTYGTLGKEFIHVHHSVLVSEMGAEYKIDPLKEMVPVCPNCHAMLHRRNPPYSIEEIKIMIKEHN